MERSGPPAVCACSMAFYYSVVRSMLFDRGWS